MTGFKLNKMVNMRNVARNRTTCTRRVNVVFLKVPKSASSTTSKLLWRFVVSHNLNPLIRPKVPFHINNPLDKTELLEIPRGQSYNVLASHMTYSVNKYLIPKMMPNDTAYIGIVREPVSRFQSSLLWSNTYKVLRKRASGNTAGISDADLLLKHIKDTSGSVRAQFNEQSRYYGITRNNLEEGIQETLKTFDLILIVEFYDESLVLLKRRMCWDMQDILYRKTNVQNYTEGQRNILSNAVIRQWFNRTNQADIVFYDRCLVEFKRKVEAEGNDFQKEVQQFQLILQQITAFCSSRTTGKIVVEESRWNSEFNFSISQCAFFELDGRAATLAMIAYHKAKMDQLRKN